MAARPEHLTVGDGPITATVRTVEWLGHERHLICDLNGHDVVVREPSAGVGMAPGTAVQLVADPAEVHLFDPETSERLN